MLSEICKSWKDKEHVVPLIWGIQSHQIPEDSNSNGGRQGQAGAGSRAVAERGWRVSALQDGRVQRYLAQGEYTSH